MKKRVASEEHVDDDPIYLTASHKIPSGKRLHNYGKSPLLMGKSTISMAIFNSNVSLPEGISHGLKTLRSGHSPLGVVPIFRHILRSKLPRANGTPKMETACINFPTTNRLASDLGELTCTLNGTWAAPILQTIILWWSRPRQSLSFSLFFHGYFKPWKSFNVLDPRLYHFGVISPSHGEPKSAKSQGIPINGKQKQIKYELKAPTQHVL